MGAVLSPSDPKRGRRIARRPGDSIVALQEALAGRYVIERELGRGGMGIVYLASDLSLERLVALKILPPSIATTPRRERFLREARLAARLEHDHIVPIYTVDEAGPFVYYTMAYVRGESLYERILIEGSLPVGEATRILHDVAQAVHYAHSRGVIHRDLKPQNILIERGSGRAYVADFGLARVMSEEPPPGGGNTFGTVAFMSPEQAAGRTVDHRSDIYSLGVVGYFMAAGRPLFTGTAEEVLEHHIATPAPPLPVVGVHLDTTLARAVGRCLAKNPGERFQSAGELARALSLAPELRADLPEPLRRFVNRLQLESRRFAGGGMLFGVLTVGFLLYAVRAGDWATAAKALGLLGVLLVSPVLSVLPATRRLLRAHHDRADIVHALKVELDRQREQLAKQWGQKRDVTSRRVRRVMLFAMGVCGFGLIGAAAGVDLPEAVVMGSVIGGAFTTLLSGGVLAWRERQRNTLWGHRWLAFWESKLGEWTAKVAGIGLRRVQSERDALAPSAPPEQVAERASALPSELQEFADEVHMTESCVRRIRALREATTVSLSREGKEPTAEEVETDQVLERQLVVLEALLEKFQSIDAETVDVGSLTEDLERVREVREVVEGLMG